MINIVEVATLGNQTIFIEKNKDGGFSVYKSMDNALLGIASPSLTAFYSQTELETMYLRSIRLNNQADPIAVIGQIIVHAEVNGWKAWIKPLEMATEALRGPWVKTSDRPPTHKDAYLHEKVLARGRDNGVAIAHYANVRDFPNIYISWAPIPPLPEGEEQGGNHD